MNHRLARVRIPNPVPKLAVAAIAILLSACQSDLTSPTVEPDGLGAPLATVDESHGHTTRRSLEEFLAAQGTYCINNPSDCVDVQAPLPELIQYVNGEFTIVSIVDYFGQADPYLRHASGGRISLGTTVEGSVTERVLKDGRVLVHVIVRTRNALMYAAGPEFLAGDPLFFGATVGEVLHGATPALGTSFLESKYITTAPGLPLPDLVQISYFPESGQEELKLNFHAKADGLLREASGFPEGTPGRLSVKQVANFKKPGPDGNPYSVETITLKPRRH